MYDKQLKTFLAVVEAGSFNKAARQLYVSASAVIQQINNLESDLSVTLFQRTRQGIQLTEAGEYLASEAKEYIARGEEIRSTIRRMQTKVSDICVGTSNAEKCRLLYDLWMLFRPRNAKYEIRLSMIDKERGPDDSIQMIESVADGAPWQRGWSFLEICRIPIACALPKQHPHYASLHLRFSQMADSGLILIDRSGRGDNHPLAMELFDRRIPYEIKPDCDGSVIWEASIHNRALIVPAVWQDILYDLKVIPCDLQYEIPYGFFYREDASESVREFLDFTRSVYSGEDPQGIVPVL